MELARRSSSSTSPSEPSPTINSSCAVFRSMSSWEWRCPQGLCCWDCKIWRGVACRLPLLDSRAVMPEPYLQGATYKVAMTLWWLLCCVDHNWLILGQACWLSLHVRQAVRHIPGRRG